MALQDVTSRPVYPGCISQDWGLLWMWQQISSRPQSQSASEAKSFCKAECFQRIFKTQFRNRGIWGPLGNVPWGEGSTCLMTRSRRYLCYQHPRCPDGKVANRVITGCFLPSLPHGLLKLGPTAGEGNANLFFGPKHLFSFQIMMSQISVIINLVNNMIW